MAVKKTAPGAEPLYNMSVAARLCGLPAYTIRWVEKNGLLAPSRTGGNQRLFSDRDIALLREIAALLRRSVNLEGVRVVLEIRGYGVFRRPRR